MASNPLIRSVGPNRGESAPNLRTTNPLIRAEAVRGAGHSGGVASGLRRVEPAVPAAALAIAAGLVHLWVAPQHLASWWAYGAFFLAIAIGQAGLGLVLLRRPAPGAVFAALWINLAIVVTYVVERTAGLPTWLQPGGSDTGHSNGDNAATMDAFGTAASVAEIGLIVLLAAMLPGLYRRLTMNGLMVVGVVLWGLRLAGLL